MRRFGTIGFVVGATLCDSSRDSIVATDRDDWRRGVGDDGDGHGAAIAHVAVMVATLPKEHRVRYIAFRHGMGALGVGTDALGGGIGDGVGPCRLRFLATNDPSPDADGTDDPSLLARDMWEIRNAANARCGDSEQAHGIVKSDCAGGMVPSGRFGANGCWVFLAGRSHNLVRAGRDRMVGGTRWMRVRMKAFRTAFLYRSGRRVSHANHLVGKVPATGNGRWEEGGNKLIKRRV